MADSFLTALQDTAYDIGSNLPKQTGDMYPNVTNTVSNVSAPKAPSYKNGTSLGTVTVKPGGSTRYEKVHPGIDIANAIGTQLPAFTGGAVTEVKTGQVQGSPAYGNYVIITDKDGNKHRYSHMSNSLVKVGDQVTEGQIIGGMGNTGQTYSLSGGDASHLDYRILNAYGKYVDPTGYVTALTGI